MYVNPPFIADIDMHRSLCILSVVQDESSSGSESEEEAPNAYQELISSIAPATREDSNDEDIEDGK